MFCHKCGTEIIEGAVFCQKCGAKIPYTDAGEKENPQQSVSSASVRQTQPQTPDGSVETSKKKKTGKLVVFLGVVILVCVVIITAMNWNGKVDYVESVAAHTPFANTQGLPYTYEEVLNKYIVSPEWEERQDGDEHYIDISGTMKGTDYKVVITIKVSPDSSDPNMALINPESVVIDGEQSPTQNDAVEFLLVMFSAYDEGYSDLSELLSQNELPDVPKEMSEPIENYYGLSGAYSGSLEQSTLSLSIYSSQEEGEVAIGNVEIYVEGGWYYSGNVVPIEKDVYQVVTETGEEVLLVASTSDSSIGLQLYVDGEYIEEYWMTEHYES